jgi:FlaA1/EpsC-like NDP-sugar epimerase
MISAQLLIGRQLGLYTGRWRYGTFDEIRSLVRTTASTTAILLLLNLAVPHRVHERSLVGAGMLALLMMMGVRYAVRMVREKRMRPSELTARRVLVLGAGDGGAQIISAMLHSPDSPYVPVGLLDDDVDVCKLRICGVPVMGTRHDLAAVVKLTGARTLVIAIPTASAALIREVMDLAAPLKVEVRVLPPVAELLGGVPGVSDIRRVTYADLLGRREIEIDLASVAGYLAGRRVLVTGAGGSIGSELCRQISRFRPSELIMLDRDESALHALQMSMEGRALLRDENLVVADIRDRDRLFDIFEVHAPQVVFHAAALKTNIVGTQHVLDVCLALRVSRFVNISTDKAADPSSVLGYTKRITERLTASADEAADGSYLSVRFGNVLGSRGSVLPAFRQQIEAGGPVTVTDPEVTRYFMTVEEAVCLVIQSGAIGGGGQVLVFDMGQQVKIAEIAQRLIDASGHSVDIIYTGLRPGEKLHEALLGSDEPDLRPVHQLISQVVVPPLDATALAVLNTGESDDQVRAMLRWLAHAPPLSGRALRVRPKPAAADRLGRWGPRGRTVASAAVLQGHPR